MVTCMVSEGYSPKNTRRGFMPAGIIDHYEREQYRQEMELNERWELFCSCAHHAACYECYERLMGEKSEDPYCDLRCEDCTEWQDHVSPNNRCKDCTHKALTEDDELYCQRAWGGFTVDEMDFCSRFKRRHECPSD